MPDATGPAKFMDERNTPSPSTTLNGPDALRAQEQRLRELAERGDNYFDMAAYGRFLHTKMNDAVNGLRWQRRATELARSKLSPNVTYQETYHNR